MPHPLPRGLHTFTGNLTARISPTLEKSHLVPPVRSMNQWQPSVDLTRNFHAPIQGPLTPNFVKSPVYPREGVGHDIDKCITFINLHIQNLVLVL